MTRAIQTLKKEAGLPATDCALCGIASETQICGPCATSLDRVGVACPGCALPLGSPDLCGMCLKKPPSFDGAVALFTYRFPLDRLVQRFKYSGDLAVGRWLASQLADRAAAEERPHAIVVPPLTRARLRERGFNQALEIAKVVAKRLDVRCHPHAVIRVHEDPAQAGLSRHARLANLRSSFRCDMDLRGQDMVVIDDVLTTGATAEAMARSLKGAGAARVRVWAVARTPAANG